MEIDPSSPVHPYRQLADRLREKIASGEITNQLPSITKLTEATMLAVGTVRRGIDILVKEGLVETVPRRGPFVIDQRPPPSGAASGHVEGPANAESTRGATGAALPRWPFGPGGLRDVPEPALSASLLGSEGPAPIGLAPTGYTRAIPQDGEPAVARAAASRRVP